ncbi:HNH endonuclease [Aquimixticola soesokkakensis]|uniref:Putative HNH nuclease YajD n=1 Tax=Aquimixticola soesokkakensis TaxID=1519096 RepID=A0A1Y5SCU1_9RHOB|nr:HNH endonuclease signature motif containing protein [Aquimixticola soesokkakensis]SLN36704.1 HNH endonuclease [Aquimixticola soesokkakensis]
MTLNSAHSTSIVIIYSCAHGKPAGAFAFIPQQNGVLMARLKLLRDGVHRMPSIVRYLPQGDREHDRVRMKANPLRRLYGTAKWQKLRWGVLQRDMFTCRTCGRLEADTSLLVADHITPHRGSEELFWDEQNLQCLCKRCHDTVKQREEKRGGR